MASREKFQGIGQRPGKRNKRVDKNLGLCTIVFMASEIEKLKSTNKLLIVGLLVASFFLGSLTNRIATLEKNGTSPAPQANVPAAANPQPQAITKDTIKQWAKELGLNSNQFNSCLDSEKFKTAIEEDTKAGAAAQVSGTPSFLVNGILLVGAQPFDAFKTAIDQELSGTTPDSSIRTAVDVGHLPALGDKNAKVTIVEFADLECPFCKRYFVDTFPQIKKEYIDTGKVAYYYRHFPLSFHPLALPFANASECANEQKKFWEMHDRVFQD